MNAACILSRPHFYFTTRQAMRDMYLTEPASFDDILATLADLENRINHTGSG